MKLQAIFTSGIKPQIWSHVYAWDHEIQDELNGGWPLWWDEDGIVLSIWKMPKKKTYSEIIHCSNS